MTNKHLILDISKTYLFTPQITLAEEFSGSFNISFSEMFPFLSNIQLNFKSHVHGMFTAKRLSSFSFRFELSEILTAYKYLFTGL